LLVDVQERLFPLIANGEQVEKSCGILLEAMRQMEIPIVVSEQYTKGLGPTIPTLSKKIPSTASRFEKMHFSCFADSYLRSFFMRGQRRSLIVGGIEAHVCVMQTALDALDAGFRVAVIQDAVGSRSKDDMWAGLARLRYAGAELVTTEMILFELLHISGTPVFKSVQSLVK
jgi:nicotinamidase-related amidase